MIGSALQPIALGGKDMFDLTQHPNSNILYITLKGKITDDDYEDVLIPAMEATLREFEKIRLLIHMGEAYDGIEGEAIWDDTKVGMKHFTHGSILTAHDRSALS